MFRWSKSLRPKTDHGTTLAELPFGLWIIFIGIGFPMTILASLTIRYALFWNAAREAAEAASQCQTFQTDPPPPATGVAALTAASDAARRAVGAFSGISVNGINVYIVITPVSQYGSTQPQYWGPNVRLAAPADPQENMYQILVTLDGQVDPLLKIPPGILGSIPGLTAPFPAQVSEERVFENVQGLSY